MWCAMNIPTGWENVISSIDKSGQGGGLKEGYSDVMGEMAEAYTFGRDPDWENRYRVFHTGAKRIADLPRRPIYFGDG